MADAFLTMKRMHVFAQVDDKGIKAIAPHFEEVNYKAGDIIFKEYDSADYFYTIESGQVEVLLNFKSGKPRRLALLSDADYFGERGLAKRTTRNATVRAVKDTRLWRISVDKFNALMLRNASVKAAIDVAIQSREYARQEKFHKWLRENETVYLVTLQHRVFLIPLIAYPSGVIIGGVILSLIFFFFQLGLVWQVAPLLIVLGGAGWFYWNWVDFHNDWYIVTSQRVIDIDKIVLLYESRAEAPLPVVQNAAVQTTEWGRQLGYGDVTINTFSGPIKFHNIPNPQAVSDLILEQVNRTRIQQKTAERNALKNSLKTAMGIEKPPTPPPPPPMPQRKPSSSSLLFGWLKQITLQVREQKGDTVIYRKHPFVLAQELGAQLGGVLIILILLLLSVINLFTKWFAVIDLNYTLILWVVSLVPLGALAVNIGYEYFDWKNDIYMVTPTQVFDIERKPFGTEQRKSANLDAVGNVAFIRPDFISYLLNYGTVTIQAGPGGEMKFFNVFDPLGVQQDIYRRKEQRERTKAEAAARARHDEYAQYFGTFYEILEEERKKKDQGGPKSG